MDLEAYRHPTWPTAAATIVAYGVLLLAMFALLFVVPTILFVVL